MGGEGTFVGTNHQAGVISYIYAHLIAQMRLGWLDVDDTPVAVAGETGGPGDDVRIEFGTGRAPIEVQAKYGLNAGAKLNEALDRIKQHGAGPVVIAVDRGSSRKVHYELRMDLDRLRSGRQDRLTDLTKGLVEKYGEGLLRDIRLIPVDLTDAYNPDVRHAVALLTSLLENSDQAPAAWDALLADAGALCAKRLRRDRKDLIEQLEGKGFKVKPARKDERWHRQLDFSRELLRKKHAAAALSIVMGLLSQSKDAEVDSEVRFRIAQQYCTALLQLGRYEDAVTEARKALDIKPNAVHALVNGALAAMLAGDLATAISFADRAVASDPNDANSWGAKAQVAAVAGHPAPTPPRPVALSEDYRTALAQIAFNASDWSRVKDLTTDLLSLGSRSDDVLMFRATAFANLGGNATTPERKEQCQEAERLASEFLNRTSDETHPYVLKMLVVRASTRKALGKNQAAIEDLEAARRLDVNDPSAIGQAAQWKYRENDLDGALTILQHPVVDDVPMLTTLRARLMAEKGNREAARRDLERSLPKITNSFDPDSLRFTSADVALAIDDIDLADRVLAATSTGGKEDPRYLGLRGRLLFARGDSEQAFLLYQDAANKAGAEGTEYLTELASQLFLKRKVEDAVRVFDQIGEERIPVRAQRLFTLALLKANELSRAQHFIETRNGDGTLPDWALDIATEIAVRSEDESAAIEHLSELVARGESTTGAQLELARRLLEQEHVDAAIGEIEAVLRLADVGPLHRMQAAQLLLAAGRSQEALEQSFRAFRDAPQDPRLHRVFIVIALMSKTVPAVPTETGPQTHVILNDQHGTRREYTIYSGPPIDRTRNEMLTEEAAAADLLGRKVGEVIVRFPGGWNEERWTVIDIRSAIHHQIQDAMQHYEERFPGEPFFMKGFLVGDGASIKEFSPLIASLEARRTHVERVLERYEEQILPLSMTANLLGSGVADLMAEIGLSGKRGLYVEWSNRDGQEEAKEAANRAFKVVLTRSALYTAHELRLLESLPDSFSLLAPTSLRADLRKELAQAKRLVAEGHQVIVTRSGALDVQELAANHPLLQQKQDTVAELLEWIDKHTSVQPRPLTTIAAPESRQEEARELLGESSYDAIALARHEEASLYADDLGVRRFLPPEHRALSFSSVGLIRALAERGIMDSRKRDEILIDLVNRRYMFIPASRELLQTIVTTSSTVSRSTLEDVFGLLAGPSMTLQDSSLLLVQVVKSNALSGIQTMTTEEIVLLGLEAMAKKWRKELVIHAVTQAAREHLALLPHTLGGVFGVCEIVRKPQSLQP